MNEITFGLLLFVIGSTSSALAAVTLTPDTVPAHGKHSAILSIPVSGRYSVTVESAQGTALQLVDRMRGPADWVGEAGVSNGRIDAFLEPGTYKIVTHAAERGAGSAPLKVRSFEEQQQKPVALANSPWVTTTLKDFEQRSYWLRVERDQVVPLEAIGRSLSDLRIWRDGVWLTDTVPQSETTEPAPGQPLHVLRFAPRLARGVYRVTAYGGPALPWAEAAPQSPLYVRSQIPRAAVAARQQFTMNETGIARVRVPKDATYFRLELTQSGAATLRVEDGDENIPFGRGFGNVVTINPKSTVPMVDVSRQKSGTDFHLVTILAPAGTRYILQHFEASVDYPFNVSGDYYVSTIHAGPAGDAIDATAVLTRRELKWHNDHQPEAFIDARVIEFDAARGWRRRFNLLGDTRVMFRLAAPARLRVSGTEVAAQYRIQPFVTFRPGNFRTPPWRESGAVFELNAGLFELEIHPQERGILSLALQVDGAAAPAESAAIPSAHFGRVHFDTSRGYAIHTNREPGVANGVILRPWPVDLTDPLPIAQGARQSIEIAVRVAARGQLLARDETGAAVPLRVGARDSAVATTVDRGDHTVRIDAPGTAPRDIALEFIPDVTPVDTSWVNNAIRSTVPAITLQPRTPLYLDLPRNGQTAVNLHVDAPALYRIETSGLLDTAGLLSTRTQPGLMRDDTSGAGRNFLLQTFLREGDYQLNVSTAGVSAGHLGLHAEQTALIDAGSLRANEVARATLPSGRGLRYRFRIDHRATYQLRTLGLNRVMRVRVDDRDAWPIVTPGIAGDLTREFEPGDYEVIVLPEPITARVVTVLRDVSEPPKQSGHSPHTVELNQSVQHEWREPEGGAARQPDDWEFSLPARAAVRVHIDQNMQASLTRHDSATRDPIATVNPLHPFDGTLEAGTYRLAAQSMRHNNRVQYTLTVATDTLLDGTTHELAVPVTIPMSVGRDGWVDVFSLGEHDVRARLYDERNVLIAESDDAIDDWNFRIAQALPVGAYRLVIEPVAAESARTTVTLRMAPEQTRREATWGSDNVIQGHGVHTFELAAPSSADALYVGIDAPHVVGLQIEAAAPSGWQTLSTQLRRRPWVVIPRMNSEIRRYRIRLWNSTGDGEQLHWRAQALTLTAQLERSFAQGNLRWTPVADGAVLLARAALSATGVLRFAATSDALLWGDQSDQALRALTQLNVSVAGRHVWLARTGDNATNTVAAQMIALSPAGPHHTIDIELPAQRDAAVQLAGVNGDAVVIATARDAQPGIATVKSNAPTHMAVTPNSALTLVDARDRTFQLWNTAESSHALATQIRAVALRREERAPLALGSVDAEIKSHELIRHQLSVPDATTRWTLEPGTGVALRRARETVAMLWSGTRRHDESVDVSADEAWVFNTGDADARYSVEVSHANGPQANTPVTPGHLLVATRNFPNAGSWRVAVGAGTQRLHIRGAERITAIDSAGRVQRTRDIALTGPAVVEIEHGIGAVTMWFDAERLASEEPAVPPVGIPSRVNLSGALRTLHIERTQPTLIRVRSGTPAVLQWTNASGTTVDDAFPNGAGTTLFAPTGTSTLQVRALGAPELSGSLALDDTPVTALEEGVGPQLVLGPGDARLFTFNITRAGAIGVGIRASSDDVEAVVYDSRGNTHGHGIVLMPSLAPGQYYLAVRVPERGKPVTLQPIVVGSASRDTRPPADIVRRFVESKPDAPLITAPENEKSPGAFAQSNARARMETRSPENSMAVPEDETPPDESHAQETGDE